MDELEKYTAVVEGQLEEFGAKIEFAKQVGGGKGVEGRPEELCGEGGRWWVRKYCTLSSVAN